METTVCQNCSSKVEVQTGDVFVTCTKCGSTAFVSPQQSGEKSSVSRKSVRWPRFSVALVLLAFFFLAVGMLVFKRSYERNTPRLVVRWFPENRDVYCIEIVVHFSDGHLEDYRDLPPYGSVDYIMVRGLSMSRIRGVGLHGTIELGGPELPASAQKRYHNLRQLIAERGIDVDSLAVHQNVRLQLPREFPTYQEFLKKFVTTEPKP